MTKTQIMKKAWEIYKKNSGKITFGESLHRAWNCSKQSAVNEKIIADAKAEAGVEEETDTWYGWRKRGFEVIHESKALFKCVLGYASKGDDAVYKASFFGFSQVAPVAA